MRRRDSGITPARIRDGTPDARDASMTKLISCVMALATSTVAGCYIEEHTAVVADTETGELIEVSPGVEVVADLGTSVFFVENSYWWYADGVWYSSPWYRGGWTRVRDVPVRLHGIRNPGGYVRYHPPGYVPHRSSHGGSHGPVVVRSRPAPRGGRR